MERFALLRPTRLDAAVAALAAQPEGARPIAGGTAVVPMWRERLLHVATLVDLGRLEELRGISFGDRQAWIGAGTTLGRIEDSDEVRQRLPLLHAAVRRTANRRIREMATLGGALCQGDPASDASTGALASDAIVRTVSPQGQRALPLNEFFQGLYETVLAPDEIATQICFPIPSAMPCHAYLRFNPRSYYDRPTVAVAVAWQRAPDGRCLDVRLALGGVAPTPFRCATAEAALEGRRPDEAAVRAAGEAARDAADPLADLRGSAEYKREMACVFVRRAVLAARDR